MGRDNRAWIKAQSLKLFAMQGFESVSVQEIVDAAGITKPTLYHYFGSKQGLLQVLLSEELQPLLSSVGKAVEYRGDLVLSLRRIVQAYFDYAEAAPKMVRFLLSAQYAPPQSDSHLAVAEIQERLMAMTSALFAQALPHLTDRSRRYAISLLGLISAYLTLALQGDLILDDELIYAVVQQYLYGIYS